MSSKLNNVKISLRTDDLSNWTSVNPILLEGEIAIVVDENKNEKIKIGNGISAFNELKYFNQAELKSDKISTTELTTKSFSQGYNVKSTPTSLATGIFTEADGNFGVVHGVEAKISEGDDYAFVFNGENLPGVDQRYVSHGEGSFNVNPLSGLNGFYIGDKSLCAILSNYSTRDMLLSSTTLRTWTI